MAYPELSLRLLPPGQMTAPEIVGATVEGGRTFGGIGPTADVSGGGFWTVRYAAIGVDSVDPARYRYYEALAARLSGSRNAILVPFLTDFTTPWLTGETLRKTIPFSDGRRFSDGAGFRQPLVVAGLVSDAALNAGTITFDVSRGTRLFGGETFEIRHPVRSSRPYRIYAIDSRTVTGDVTRYQAAIRPPLREAAPAGTFMRFERPRCLMKVQGRMQLQVTPPWQARPEITFVEAFPS